MSLKSGSGGAGRRMGNRSNSLTSKMDPVKSLPVKCLVNYPSLKGGACERLNKTKQFD